MFFLPPEIGPILVLGSIDQIGSTHNTNEAEKTLESETDRPENIIILDKSTKKTSSQCKKTNFTFFLRENCKQCLKGLKLSFKVL